jgi:signal transduction histidine kinase
LDEVGLSSALRWYLEGFTERSKINVDFSVPDDFGRLARELETAIFRIVQECLTNIHRHSGSSVARVRVTRTDDEILVSVEDQGKGIPQEKQKEMGAGGKVGVGLRGMKERIRQLNGNLEIKSNGQGTIIVARLPIPSTLSTAVA